MDAKYYQDKRRREKESSMTDRQRAERKEEKDFFAIVVGVIIGSIIFIGLLGTFSYYDAKQRKADADSCENIGGKYMVVEKSGKTQIWGCVK